MMLWLSSGPVEGRSVNGVSAEDVLQGKINNCYLRAGYRYLHYRPESIQDRFRYLVGQFEVVDEGKYRFPEPITVTVDSNSFVDEDVEPIYTHSSTGELADDLGKGFAPEYSVVPMRPSVKGKLGMIRAFTAEPYT